MRIATVLACLCTATGISATAVQADDGAPNVLKREPYFLSPASVVYVDNGSCSAGKVLKVTGALGAIQRKRICVPMGREEVSRVVATP